MSKRDLYGVTQFLHDYPWMTIEPSRGADLILKGKFDFKANIEKRPEIVDSYSLWISVPSGFPQALPEVKELDRKIPRDGKHHVNPDDTLCLGSPLRLLKKVNAKPNLTGFAEDCLVPFLYAISHKLLYGGDFIFSELPHGEEGILDDYQKLFDLTNSIQVKLAIKLLGMKKRLANKHPCPCGCDKRLGKCVFHLKLNKYRTMASRTWFKKHFITLGSGM